MGFRDRQRGPARRASSREPKRRLLVVCDGDVTEPDYSAHLKDPFRDNPGQHHRDQIRAMLRSEHLTGYDKAIATAHFTALAPGLPAAITRADRLAADAADLDDDPFKNPTIGVYRLIQSISRTDDTPGGTTS
jgi:hypothetical protein